MTNHKEWQIFNEKFDFLIDKKFMQMNDFLEVLTIAKILFVK